MKALLARISATLLLLSVSSSLAQTAPSESFRFAAQTGSGDAQPVDAANLGAAAPTESSLAPGNGDPHAACDMCCDACCNDPLWTIRAGALFLQRSSPRGGSLLQDFGTRAILLDAKNFNFGFEPGVDFSLMRRIGDNGNAVEARYFGINGWSDTQSVTVGNSVVPTNPVFALLPGGPITIDATYTTRLFSTEANWRHQVTDNITWLAGFRWLQVHDRLTYNTTIVVPVGIDFDTTNNLYGGQIGADIALWPHRSSPWELDSVFKVGLYGNSAEHTSAVTINQVPLFSSSDQRGQLAFAAEIGVNGAYHWNDHIAVRSGYEVMWIDKIATASDQLSITNLIAQNGIDTSGNVFFHGATTSLQLTW